MEKITQKYHTSYTKQLHLKTILITIVIKIKHLTNNLNNFQLFLKKLQFIHVEKYALI